MCRPPEGARDQVVEGELGGSGTGRSMTAVLDLRAPLAIAPGHRDTVRWGSAAMSGLSFTDGVPAGLTVTRLTTPERGESLVATPPGSNSFTNGSRLMAGSRTARGRQLRAGGPRLLISKAQRRKIIGLS